MIRMYLVCIITMCTIACTTDPVDVSVSGAITIEPEPIPQVDPDLTIGANTFLQVSGSQFQPAGFLDATTQLYVAQIFNVLDGQTITAASAAVQCVGGGGGYFMACARIREIGAWQCSSAIACGASASAAIPMAPLTVGPSTHLDLGVLGTAPTFIPTTAVITVTGP